MTALTTEYRPKSSCPSAGADYEEAEVIEEAVQLETVPESRWEEQYLLGIGLGVLGMLAAALVCVVITVCRKYRKGGRNAREKEPQSR